MTHIISLLYVSFLMLFCKMAAALTKEFIYISDQKTWDEAQTFCRQNYVDLATVTSLDEQNRLVSSGAQNWVLGWIGLQKPLTLWQWSDGALVSYTSWRSTQPNNIANENCGNTFATGWNDYYCSYLSAFFCYRNWILVKQNKTWDEALDFCRKNHKVLASQSSLTQQSLADLEAVDPQTPSVWLGLRFLNGKWICLNNEPLNDSGLLPSCAAPKYRCGARNRRTLAWENRDCGDKLNFICY